ncbi:MAG TPA: S8 family peptidase [Longimicrobium sp.]|jgi:subtilisin family serine protease
MNRGTFALLGGALALAGCSVVQDPTSARPTPGETVRAAAPGQAIPGSYIVVLKEGADPRSVAAVAQVSPRYVYSAALNGFAAELNQGQLNALQHNPAVDYVEEDSRVQSATTQSGATWGLDRIDQRALPLSGTYNYTSTGSTVYAYVIDTGIQTSHAQFGGRAAVSYDALGGNGQDCNGHGTHVAGTIGSTTYGVAKQARLRAVRVLNCQGSGTASGVIAGIDWVRLNRTNPAVANMSLGGGYSSAQNTAVTNLVNSGVFLAVAAGNENQNACNVSPASAPAVTTVAASDRTDLRASFSNYGSCVDIYAPGVSITSTWLSGGTNTISGTSMASPHVAGVAVLYKATYGDASQSTINSWLVNNSTASVIRSNPTGTPNRLLYKAAL